MRNCVKGSHLLERLRTTTSSGIRVPSYPGTTDLSSPCPDPLEKESDSTLPRWRAIEKHSQHPPLDSDCAHMGTYMCIHNHVLTLHTHTPQLLNKINNSNLHLLSTYSVPGSAVSIFNSQNNIFKDYYSSHFRDFFKYFT